MTSWEELSDNIVKPEGDECEELIITLSSLSEIVAFRGFSAITLINRGIFDEGDMDIEEIPDVYQQKVKLVYIENDFFRFMLFLMSEIEDERYAHHLIERYISTTYRSQDEYRAMALQYVSLCMVSQKRLPWEIEYRLRKMIHKEESMDMILDRYKREEESDIDCNSRYLGHWQIN